MRFRRNMERIGEIMAYEISKKLTYNDVAVTTPLGIKNTSEIGDKIVGVLKTIYDPEIPVDIYELGLIYDVFVNEKNDAKILMTLTSPNCPAAESMPAEIEQKITPFSDKVSLKVVATDTESSTTSIAIP